MWQTSQADSRPSNDTGGPTDAAREAEALFALEGPRHALGTVNRGWLLLDLMLAFCPTPTLEDAYFANLRRLLAERPVRAQPGRLVLGMGPGRCGSTSLTHLVRSVPEACATHENPPLLHWAPTPAQVAFHLRRFTLLRQHFAVVFDAAHWWLNAAPAVMAALPDTLMIGLRRNAAATVESFLRIKLDGAGSFNHWVSPGDPYWQASNWDLAYPDYAPPPSDQAAGTATVAGTSKAALIGRYVAEYYAAQEALAARWPGKVMLLRTEALSSPVAQESIYRFINAGPGMIGPVRLNANTIEDGVGRYWF